ncbi:MAG TPA: hypothetical protein VIG24_07545 [Acidimicrobiia bacterium]
MDMVYLVMGALSFWSIVIVGVMVGSVAIAEWWQGRMVARDASRIRRLTPEQTDRLIREWRQ